MKAREWAILLLLCVAFFIVMSAPFARIDSDGELAYFLFMDTLAGVAMVSVALLIARSRPFTIMAIVIGLGVSGTPS